jgi:hypothetical protein
MVWLREISQIIVKLWLREESMFVIFGADNDETVDAMVERIHQTRDEVHGVINEPETHDRDARRSSDMTKGRERR